MTREDVLREFWCAEALAGEVVRLRRDDVLAALGGDE